MAYFSLISLPDIGLVSIAWTSEILVNIVSPNSPSGLILLSVNTFWLTPDTVSATFCG